MTQKQYYNSILFSYFCRNITLTITWFSIQTAGLAFGGTGLCSYRVRGVGGSFAEHLTVESYTIIFSLQSYFYYWYSITHSLFHSRLKSFLFCESSLPQPFLFLLQDSLYGFPTTLRQVLPTKWRSYRDHGLCGVISPYLYCINLLTHWHATQRSYLAGITWTPLAIHPRARQVQSGMPGSPVGGVAQW